MPKSFISKSIPYFLEIRKEIRKTPYKNKRASMYNML